jgi:hypothetical protein
MNEEKNADGIVIQATNHGKNNAAMLVRLRAVFFPVVGERP